MLNGQRQCVFNCQGKAQFHLPAKAHVQKQTCFEFFSEKHTQIFVQFLTTSNLKLFIYAHFEIMLTIFTEKCQQNPVENWS